MPRGCHSTWNLIFEAQLCAHLLLYLHQGKAGQEGRDPLPEGSIPTVQSLSHVKLFALKEISPGISLEGMMLKRKLQYFGHLMQRVDSLEKTLMLGGIGGKRRRG